MFIICLISLKTCSLYVKHTQNGETDISDVTNILYIQTKAKIHFKQNRSLKGFWGKSGKKYSA